MITVSRRPATSGNKILCSEMVRLLVVVTAARGEKAHSKLHSGKHSQTPEARSTAPKKEAAQSSARGWT